MKKYFCLFILVSVGTLQAQVFTTYMDNGQVITYTKKQESAYDPFCNDGRLIRYNDTTRKPITIFEVKNCKLNGLYMSFWDETGHIKTLGQTKNNYFYGTFYSYDINGILERITFYRRDKVIWTKKVEKKVDEKSD